MREHKKEKEAKGTEIQKKRRLRSCSSPCSLPLPLDSIKSFIVVDCESRDSVPPLPFFYWLRIRLQKLNVCFESPVTNQCGPCSSRQEPPFLGNPFTAKRAIEKPHLIFGDES
eukprot:Lithocolla_globosa_v1_NODE_4117_length_1507_cov_2.766529.p2 type:complete len:113 gc:universal NODE_4117_length_1507_cov_2.766529:1164-1502(+)